MDKAKFEKYRIKVVLINISFFIVIFGLLLLALYNQKINHILFSENLLPQNLQFSLDYLFGQYYDSGNFVFGYIWIIIAILLLIINSKYYERKRKYNKSIGLKEKDDKRFKKITFRFFLFTTIVNLLLFIFTTEEFFFGTFGFNFSIEVCIYVFLALIPNISLVLAAKFL